MFFYGMTFLYSMCSACFFLCMWKMWFCSSYTMYYGLHVCLYVLVAVNMPQFCAWVCVCLHLCVWPAGLCWYSILPPVTLQLCENVPGLNVYVWEAPGEHHTFMKFINVSYFWHPQNVLFFTLSYWWSRLELGSVDPSSY